MKKNEKKKSEKKSKGAIKIEESIFDDDDYKNISEWKMSGATLDGKRVKINKDTKGVFELINEEYHFIGMLNESKELDGLDEIEDKIKIWFQARGAKVEGLNEEENDEEESSQDEGEEGEEGEISIGDFDEEDVWNGILADN